MPRCDPGDARPGERCHRQRFRRRGPFRASRLGGLQHVKGGCPATDESLSNEVKAHGVRVNAILPGTIDTPQNREAMPNADPSTWVKLEEIADAILFLASDAARAVTGASLPVFARG